MLPNSSPALLETYLHHAGHFSAPAVTCAWERCALLSNSKWKQATCCPLVPRSGAATLWFPQACAAQKETRSSVLVLSASLREGGGEAEGRRGFREPARLAHCHPFLCLAGVQQMRD